MKKVCDELYHDGTKKCDNRLFHAKNLHEIFSCLTISFMQIVVWGKIFWDKNNFVMPYNCMEVISRPNVIKERI